MTEYLERINTDIQLERAELYLGEIQSEHFMVETHMKYALSHAQRAGELLIRVKEALAHGSFIYWIESNCAFSIRTAQLYMNLYNNRELISKAQDLAQLSAGALTISKAVEIITEGKRKDRYEKSKGKEKVSTWSMKTYTSEHAENYLKTIRQIKESLEEAREAYRIGLYSSEAREVTLRKNRELIELLEDFSSLLTGEKNNE